MGNLKKRLLSNLSGRIIFSRIKSFLGQTLIKYSSDSRPTSHPYISGDGFRKIADHLYDETKKCSAQDIKDGEIVFLKTDYLKDFFELVHPQINARYKLITHNSDINIAQHFLDHIDEKIIHWFAQNVLVSHPKLTPIPIGLENLYYYNNGVVKIFNFLRGSLLSKKESRILFGFNKFTNLEQRQAAEENLIKGISTDRIGTRLTPPNYLKRLKQYQFVASPPGNGEDCIRTWEAMYLKTIPIVKKSTATEYFHDLKLPLLLVDDWAEVKKLEEKDLEKIYRERYAEVDESALFIDYWIKKIKNA